MAYGIERDPQTKRIIGLSGYNDREIIPFDLGGTRGLKDLVPEFLFLGDSYINTLDDIFHFRYFHRLCERLYREGYRDHENLIGIPYDFRLVLDPSYRAWLFDVFRVFVEDARQKHGGLEPIVVTHSLGGILFKWFLELESPEWINHNVGQLVMVSPPFGGAIFALRAVLSGDHYIKCFHRAVHSELQRNTGVIMCLPNHLGEGSVLLGPNEDIVNHNTYRDLAETMLPFELWRDLYEPHLIKDVIKPVKYGRKVHIVLSDSKETPIGYKADTLDAYPHSEIFGHGDGFISSASLRAGLKLFPYARVMNLRDIDHTSLVSDHRTMDLIIKLAKSV